MLVMANIALELDWLPAVISMQLDNGMSEARHVLDCTSAALCQISGPVLLLRLAQDYELHASVGGLVVVVWGELGADGRQTR